jgi:N-methylhydantoinase B
MKSTPLDLDQVRQAIALFKQDGVQAVSICFMNSFANPAHEQAAAKLVKQEMPDAYLSVSTDLLPSIRFYERISTTALNSYVGPKLNHYLDQLVGRLKGIGFQGLLLIMQSNGGVISPQLAREKAALTLLSGPAGGPGAGLFYVTPHGQDKCITTDMGGTSFEASVAVGSPMIKNDGEIARHKIALPMLDIHTIGAGGGSIGWLDEGGMLRMGPQSAGADPGPACYGKGGQLPATTDANVVLGYLDPNYFAGGKMKLDVAAARKAIETHIAKPMGLSIEDAAAGMYRVACNNMAQGVREVTIKRGFDPREFPFIPAGGAGPIHSCLICEELEIPLQIVPRESSVLCAFGMLMSELKHDFVRTFVAKLDAVDWKKLGAMIDEMAAEGARQLSEERIAENRRRHDIKFDCRYIKQYHEVSFLVPRELVAKGDVAAIARAFHAEHNRLYGYSLEAENPPIEIINVRVQSIGFTDKPSYRGESFAGEDASGALKGKPQHVHPRDQEVRRGTGLRRPQDALRQSHRRPGHGGAGNDGHLRLRRLRLRGRRPRLLRHLPQGTRRPRPVLFHQRGGHGMTTKIDPILLSVYARTFKSITDEMSISMEQTTRSPILCEAKDYVTGLYDADGNMLEQTENLPILAFSLAPVCKYIKEYFGDEIYPGDVIFHNDVFSLGNQNNDVAAFKPVFFEDKLVAWTAVKGHQADIGGNVAGGYNPNAVEVWQEALRIPPVKVVERGKLRKDVWNLIFANVRLDIVQHDMKAEMGACTVGERRMLELLKKYGVASYETHKQALFDATRKMMEAEIAKIPNGKYSGEGYVYYDGRFVGSKYTVRVDIEVKDKHIKFDYSRTDPQTNGFVNGTFTSSASATILTLLQMVNPDIPHNEGMVQPIEIVIPEGTILNAAYPKATTFGNHLCPPNADAIQRALAPVMPDRVTAGWNNLLASLTTGIDPEKNEKYVDIGFMGLKGGSGAMRGIDGYDHIGMIDASGGVLDQDYEMFEQQTPHRLLKHELLTDSAGAGEWRGGLGVETIFEIGSPDTQLVTFGDGDFEPAFGLFGGGEGGLNFIRLHYPDGQTVVPKNKDLITGVPQGTIYHQVASGGGGYGDPKKRDRKVLAEEIRNGVITKEAAMREYGYSE